MSFENGYNIEDYIGKTIEAYEEDNKIFDKVLNVLNIFMQRNDWPMCYNEFESVTKYILKDSVDWICRTIGMFQLDPAENKNLIGWDKNLSKEFKKDIVYFTNIMSTVVEGYYSYINNPLGIDKIINIDTYNSIKLFRITRVDGSFLDLRMSNYEIEELIKNLQEILNE